MKNIMILNTKDIIRYYVFCTQAYLEPSVACEDLNKVLASQCTEMVSNQQHDKRLFHIMSCCSVKTNFDCNKINCNLINFHILRNITVYCIIYLSNIFSIFYATLTKISIINKEKTQKLTNRSLFYT